MSSNHKGNTGVILAAGTGKRLRTQDSAITIKPLTPVDRMALLERTLNCLEHAGCSKSVIVVGWQAEIVQNVIRQTYKGPMTLSFVYNPNYHLQNGISVLSARPFIQDTFILTMADHVLDSRIMALAGQHNPLPNGAALCVDYKIDSIFDMDDATKVLAREGRIISIGKKLDPYNCIDTGVFVCTSGLMTALEKVYHENGDASLSQGIQILAQQGVMECIDIEDSYWQDVDTVEMLQHAEKLLKDHRK